MSFEKNCIIKTCYMLLLTGEATNSQGQFYPQFSIVPSNLQNFKDDLCTLYVDLACQTFHFLQCHGIILHCTFLRKASGRMLACLSTVNSQHSNWTLNIPASVVCQTVLMHPELVYDDDYYIVFTMQNTLPNAWAQFSS